MGKYEGEYLRAVAFPLGGIGTGHFCIGGDGGFRQWQLFNQANHVASLPGTFIAVRVERRWREPVSRVLLCQDLHDDSGLDPAPSVSDHVIPVDSRELARELPTVGKIVMRGRYPVVELDYIDDDLPIEITLEAFSPMIPLDDKNSGLPMAYLIFRLTNPTDQAVGVSVLISLQNAVGWDGLSPISGVKNPLYGGNRNIILEGDGITVLQMENPSLDSDSPRFGQMAVATNSEGSTSMMQWDDLDELWSIFDRTGGLIPDRQDPSGAGRTYNGALCSSTRLEPGSSREVVFVIAWYFPNRYVNWDQRGLGVADQRSRFWLGNQYSNWFSCVLDVARYGFENLQDLRRKTELFRDSLFSSTVPGPVLDAASSQMSVIRSPTCFRQDDGKFFGFEGCRGSSTGSSCEAGGCCPLNCTHVWNYEQSLSRLYPALERSMRDVDLGYQMGDDGRIPHRTVLPLYLPRWHGDDRTSLVYAADGHCGTILKTYREYRISGDEEFLDGHWSGLKKSLQCAIEAWDPDEDGVFDGAQWNTYDCFLFGHNSFVSGLYLASLRAMEEMASARGEDELAGRCRSLFEGGSKELDRELWNGEYYIQAYDEEKHDRTQYGPGCHSDQLLGQWWAHQLNLGYILPREHVRKALESIHRYNLRPSMSGHVQQPRVYLKDEEGGLLICTWPRGGRPENVTTYSDEVWTGIEYAVAGAMIYEGMVDEALEIVSTARTRHDGRLRNPWNEVECGDHYARAMSSWALLEAFSGFSWDATTSTIGFSPVGNEEFFRTFFITGNAWGRYEHRVEGEGSTHFLRVDYGRLELGRIRLPNMDKETEISGAYLGEDKIEGAKVSERETGLELGSGVTIRAGEVLRIVSGKDLR